MKSCLNKQLKSLVLGPRKGLWIGRIWALAKTQTWRGFALKNANLDGTFRIDHRIAKTLNLSHLAIFCTMLCFMHYVLFTFFVWHLFVPKMLFCLLPWLFHFCAVRYFVFGTLNNNTFLVKTARCCDCHHFIIGFTSRLILNMGRSKVNRDFQGCRYCRRNSRNNYCLNRFSTHPLCIRGQKTALWMADASVLKVQNHSVSTFRRVVQPANELLIVVYIKLG